MFGEIWLTYLVVVSVATTALSFAFPRWLEQRPAPLPTPRPVTRTVPVTPRFAVPVLMYHRISPLTEQEARNALTRDLTVSPEDFDAQLRYLASNGFTLLLARDVERAIKEGRPLPAKAVAITMDDGYLDNFEHAFPILRRYRAPATIFLVTKTVDSARHLTWEQIQLMHKQAMGFGSHTVHHYELPLLELAQVDAELRESKRTIEQKLVDRITSVAYPAGAFNRLVAERARAAGYEAGWKKGGGPAQPGDDMYTLPRLRVNGRTAMKDFERKVWSGVVTRGGPT